MEPKQEYRIDTTQAPPVGGERIAPPMSELQQEFERIARPMIEWLNAHYHPHITVIITPTHAELLAGEMAFQTFDYVRD